MIRGLRANLAVVRALVRRALNEISRVPGAAIPGVLAPTIFMLGITSVFGQADRLPGFDADFRAFVVPLGLLQGAGFTGAATGVNLARDIEGGWFDRLLLCPAPRAAVLVGVVASAALRALLPSTFLFGVALAIGVDFPGVGGTAIAASAGQVSAHDTSPTNPWRTPSSTSVTGLTVATTSSQSARSSFGA